MNDKCYSFYGEDFSYDTMGELVGNYPEIGIGDVVYVAEKHRPKVARFIDVEALLEQMSEWAYDSHGCDEIDQWPDLSTSETTELEKLIASYIERVSPPNFWVVGGVKEYVVTAEDLA